MESGARTRLAQWLGSTLGADSAGLVSLVPLKGGAIQENWLATLRCEGGVYPGETTFVIRRDAPAAIASSHSRADEFALLKLAHDGGIAVPRPIAFCADPAIIGGPFAVMAKADGTGFGPKIVKDATIGGNREALGHALGRELALIHALRPTGSAFAFLGARPVYPARDLVAKLRRSLDAMQAIRPELEWGLRFVETSAPPPARITFCHHDFRTGNYMLDGSGLTAILDWEFAGWGDPMADLGWFTAKCWRFSRPDLEGGGVTSRAAFYAGYEAAFGCKVDHQAVLFWEIVAHLRWGVIALEQGHRHLSGEQHALELALTGRMVAELERAAIQATMPAAWRALHG